MFKCTGCGTRALSEPVRFAGQSFCTTGCVERTTSFLARRHVSPSEVEANAARLRGQTCPSCNGPGPLAGHAVYRVTSLIILTAWRDEVRLACRDCGRRAQVLALIWTFLLGWWGVPFGLIFTPRALMVNARGIGREPAPALLRRFAAQDAVSGWLAQLPQPRVAQVLRPLHRARDRRALAYLAAFGSGIGLFSLVVWISFVTKQADDHFGKWLLVALASAGGIGTYLFRRITRIE